MCLAYLVIGVFKALHGNDDQLGFTGGEGCFGRVVGFCHFGYDRMRIGFVTLVDVEDMIEVVAECGFWVSRKAGG